MEYTYQNPENSQDNDEFDILDDFPFDFSGNRAFPLPPALPSDQVRKKDGDYSFEEPSSSNEEVVDHWKCPKSDCSFTTQMVEWKWKQRAVNHLVSKKWHGMDLGDARELVGLPKSVVKQRTYAEDESIPMSNGTTWHCHICTYSVHKTGSSGWRHRVVAHLTSSRKDHDMDVGDAREMVGLKREKHFQRNVGILYDKNNPRPDFDEDDGKWHCLECTYFVVKAKGNWKSHAVSHLTSKMHGKDILDARKMVGYTAGKRGRKSLLIYDSDNPRPVHDPNDGRWYCDLCSKSVPKSDVDWQFEAVSHLTSKLHRKSLEDARDDVGLTPEVEKWKCPDCSCLVAKEKKWREKACTHLLSIHAMDSAKARESLGMPATSSDDVGEWACPHCAYVVSKKNSGWKFRASMHLSSTKARHQMELGDARMSVGLPRELSKRGRPRKIEPPVKKVKVKSSIDVLTDVLAHAVQVETDAVTPNESEWKSLTLAAIESHAPEYACHEDIYRFIDSIPSLHLPLNWHTHVAQSLSRMSDILEMSVDDDLIPFYRKK